MIVGQLAVDIPILRDVVKTGVGGFDLATIDIDLPCGMKGDYGLETKAVGRSAKGGIGMVDSEKIASGGRGVDGDETGMQLAVQSGIVRL